MDRRIRVKCPECAASIELRVDQQELLDLTCPRCQKLFTAKVPPPVLEIVPLEVELAEETAPVRPTRRVHQVSKPRPKRVSQLPSSNSSSTPTPSPLSYDNSWLGPTPQYQSGPHQSVPRVSTATHLKAFLIATGSIICVGMLVMFGIMIKSAVSKIDWSAPAAQSAAAPPLASNSEVEPTAASSASPSSPATTSIAVAPLSPPTTPPIGSEQGGQLVNQPANRPMLNSLPSTTDVASGAPTGNISAGNISAGNISAGNTSAGSDVTDKIILLANQIADATKDSDTEFIVDRAHPKLIQLAGGRGKMLEVLNKALEPMKTQGITVANFTVSKDVVVRRVGQNVFAVLPTTLDLKYPNRLMRSDGFLLAVSEDGGRTYTFIDGAGAAKNRSVLKQIVPELPDDLVLPVSGTPREVPQ